jgi:hypothetical protein
MLLTLLALIVIAAFLLYTYVSSERGAENGDSAAAVSPKDAELLGSPQSAEDEDPRPTQPSTQAPETEDAYADADDVRSEPEPAPTPRAQATPVERSPAPKPRSAVVADQPDTQPAPAAPRDHNSALEAVGMFYSALSDGDGASAARMVVPGKRQSGPLSAGALSRYYSSFRRPLRVRRMTSLDANTVRVTYDYVLSDGRLCRGEAAVNVVQSGDRDLVSSINTRGPC